MTDEALDIGELTPAQRATLRRLAETDAGLAMLDAIADIGDALDRERTANDTTARAAFQKEALGARDRLLEAIGSTALEKRRLYAAAMGLMMGFPAKDGDFDKMLDAADRRTPAGRARLRTSFAWLALDSDRLFGSRGSGELTATELAHNDGRDGCLDGGLSPENAKMVNDALLGAGRREKIAGVVPKGDDITNAKRALGIELGYRANDLYGPPPLRIDPDFWDAAAMAANSAFTAVGALDPRTKRPYTVTPKTLQSWASRVDAFGDAFGKARREGRPREK